MHAQRQRGLSRRQRQGFGLGLGENAPLQEKGGVARAVSLMHINFS